MSASFLAVILPLYSVYFVIMHLLVIYSALASNYKTDSDINFNDSEDKVWEPEEEYTSSADELLTSESDCLFTK